MTTKIIKTMMLTAALTIAWGCSSDNNDENVPTENVPTENPSTFAQAEKPTWSVDLTGSDPQPQWTDPDQSLYTTSTTILAKLEDELAAHYTADDRMTVFVGDECRAVPSIPNRDKAGNVFFLLKVRGKANEQKVTLTLSYYSTQLRQLFTVQGAETLSDDSDYGFDSDYVPPLLQSCKRYPVQGRLTVSLPGTMPFTAATDDQVAVFAGSECRGTGRVGMPFTVFCTSAEESLQLRYYSAQRGGIYTLTQPVTINKNETKTVTINF